MDRGQWEKDRNKNMKKYESKLVDNQFRFHLFILSKFAKFSC